MASAFAESITRKDRRRLGTLLRELREQVGLGQGELAARLGVPQSTLSKMELGHRAVDVLELRVLCRAIGTPMAEVVDRFERTLATDP